jgi:urease gamma subunit
VQQGLGRITKRLIEADISAAKGGLSRDLVNEGFQAKGESEMEMNKVLFVAHEVFEQLEKSGLNLDDRITVAKVVREVLEGSRGGYGKVSFSPDAPTINKDNCTAMGMQFMTVGESVEAPA